MMHHDSDLFPIFNVFSLIFKFFMTTFFHVTMVSDEPVRLRRMGSFPRGSSVAVNLLCNSMHLSPHTQRHFRILFDFPFSLDIAMLLLLLIAGFIGDFDADYLHVLVLFYRANV